jgi:hypothetical protein
MALWFLIDKGMGSIFPVGGLSWWNDLFHGNIGQYIIIHCYCIQIQIMEYSGPKESIFYAW